MMHGLLSDAHGNLEAFQQGVNLLRRLGAERLHFLGDAVGYLPGFAVLDVLAEENMESLLGNHEVMLLAGGITAQRDAVYQLMPMHQALGEARRQFIAALPTQRQWQAPCGPVLLVHGSPSAPTHGYVYPDTELDGFTPAAGSVVFMGHTHRPFQREAAGVRYINIGSCGLPRDAGSLGCAALFDDVTGAVQLLRFDIRNATQAALQRCGAVHPAVQAVFERPVPDKMIGDICYA